MQMMQILPQTVEAHATAAALWTFNELLFSFCVCVCVLEREREFSVFSWRVDGMWLSQNDISLILVTRGGKKKAGNSRGPHSLQTNPDVFGGFRFLKKKIKIVAVEIPTAVKHPSDEQAKIPYSV